MAHLHTDMERLDIHVALEVCEIVIESATLVPIVFAFSGLPIYVAQFPLAPLICSLPFSQPARPSRSIPIDSIDQTKKSSQ
jgi:hypothetical protein